MVTAVVGHPDDHRALHGHLAGGGQRDLQRPVGLERAVGEIAVEADGDPEAGHHIERSSDDQAGPAEAPAPGERDGQRHGQQRDGGERVHRNLRRHPPLVTDDRLRTGTRGLSGGGRGGRCCGGRCRGLLRRHAALSWRAGRRGALLVPPRSVLGCFDACSACPVNRRARARSCDDARAIRRGVTAAPWILVPMAQVRILAAERSGAFTATTSGRRTTQRELMDRRGHAVQGGLRRRLRSERSSPPGRGADAGVVLAWPERAPRTAFAGGIRRAALERHRRGHLGFVHP